MSIKSKVRFVFTINTVDYQTTFYILDGAHEDVILGLDFLTKYLAQIKIFNNSIVLSNTEAIINNCTNIKADQLDSIKKFCILSENVIFHE